MIVSKLPYDHVANKKGNSFSTVALNCKVIYTPGDIAIIWLRLQSLPRTCFGTLFGVRDAVQHCAKCCSLLNAD